MKKCVWSVFWLLSLMNLTGCAHAIFGEIPEQNQRPQQWAARIERGEIPNFFRVDQQLYRSAQPKHNDFNKLYKMGIHNILNLRQFHDDQDEIGSLPIIEYRVPISVLEPRYDDLVKAVRYITQSDTPVLVHCMQGSDRTGAVIAAYRIAIQGWSKKEAIKEMIDGGYGHHTIFVMFPRLLNSLDIKKFRRDIYQKPKSS